MTSPFHRLTTEEFASALDRFPFTRRINSVHLHHTWRPDHGQYKGADTIADIRRYHTEVMGWGDIAQHVTIAPDGAIWSGRGWNQPPVSAAGHNGNRSAGPFMLTMIGNFDDGHDRLEGKQHQVALQVIAMTQRKFDLAPETLRFHSQLSAKSCPGTAVDYQELVREVRELHSAPEHIVQSADARTMDGGPFGREALASHAIVRALSHDLPGQDDPADAEPPEDAMSATDLDALFLGPDAVRSTRSGPSGGREAPIPPEALDELRPHIINLKLGQFSGDGQISTTPGDVDAIFEDYLVREIQAAKARSQPLRLLFHAHGGLVKESAGLRIAQKHVTWWKKNNVYPIHFIWETGLFETIGQLLRQSRQLVHGVTRDIYDYTTDPILEGMVRALYAPRIWSGMKRSAELAAAQEGGAFYVARKLKEFCDTYQDEFQIELHAVGHSAGSIFHAHFIPAALALGVPSFRTLHFLAPAIRVDAFHNRMSDLLGRGRGIDHLTIFTMRDSLERSDDCSGIYRKSLLYLIYHALEPQPRTPILGMEVCLRNDRRLRDLLGLGVGRSEAGGVVWSLTPLDTGRSASRSRRHGDFDDDPSTMQSVARRVLDADDNDPIPDFPTVTAGERDLSSWSDQVDWPDHIDFLLRDGAAGSVAAPTQPPRPTQVSVPGVHYIPSGVPVPNGSRRRALCVGINEYPTAPLHGCVADVESWQTTLGSLGFSDITLLLNREATRDAILERLTELVTTSRAGDVIVFQFAGHGTQLTDVSADEENEDTPQQDEAICPIDFADGAFVIDDDVGAVFEQIPPGVNVTCFIDCCHSGTISRFGIGAPTAGGTDRRGPIPRFIVATPEMQAAHRRFRQRIPAGRSVGARGLTGMKEVLYAACLSSEVAYEEGGHGDFTVRATRLLEAGLAGLTNEQFEERLITQFGAVPRQHPRLYCHPSARSLGLLQPLAAGTTSITLPNAGGRNLASAAEFRGAATAQLLRLVANMVEEGA